MIAVKFTGDKNLDVSFEFYTYTFQKDKTVLVNEDLFEFVKGTWPKLFKKVKQAKNSKKRYLKIKRVKTPSLVPPTNFDPRNFKSNDMKITQAGHQVNTFANPDTTPPSGTTDGDGVSWYGEGIQVEGTGRSFT